MKYRFTIWLLLCAFPLLFSQSIRVKTLEEQRKKLLQEVENTNALLSQNKLNTSNALKRLELINQQIESRKEIIKILDQEVSSIDNEIRFKERVIRDLERELNFVKMRYTESIQKMYSQNLKSEDWLLFILSADNVSQSFRRMMYLREYTNWRKTQGDEILIKQDEIKVQQQALLRTKNDKNELLKEREKEERNLSQEETQKRAEVDQLQKDGQALQAEINEKRKQADALNRQIEQIIREEMEKAKKDKQAERKTESKGGFAMTKEEQKLSSNFASNRGKLPFPLKGSYKVVGLFGVHPHADLKQVTVNNNGIDIETTAGNEARAVFNGVVSRVFTLPGYNNSIIIRHGNYLTLYANLKDVYVKQGDSVATGQALGKIFTDVGAGNKTVLHFELWKEQTKQNPSLWLNK